MFYERVNQVLHWVSVLLAGMVSDYGSILRAEQMTLFQIMIWMLLRLKNCRHLKNRGAKKTRDVGKSRAPFGLLLSVGIFNSWMEVFWEVL